MDGPDQQNPRVKLFFVIAISGMLSAALGFAAEATKLQLGEVQDITGKGCTFPSHSGLTVLGVVAIVALLCFRVYCPGNRNPSSVVLLSHTLSWVAWFVAMGFYVVGLTMNGRQGDTLEYRNHYQSYYNCNVVKPGIFAAGASFALTSVILEIVYLVVTDKTATNPSTGEPSILAMC